ncbi:MAG: Oxidoreductase, aldo/keto reductase family [Myxococcales bacterium]|nr:Oxidoreductase, aldo/keto reductase family [Myxococcales bacterium]
MPVIGQGTWEMEHEDRDRCIGALRAGIDAGMTHIDTAEMYGDGYVEEAIVAPAIEGRRDQIFLVSKVLPQHATYEGTIAACERSLRRLRTDRLDLYLLHWRGSHPLAQTLAAFRFLVDEEKIRYYGVSNFDSNDLEEALEVAGEARIACNQVMYHVEERAIERLVMPACELHEIAVVAYSPFGHGRFPAPNAGPGRVLAAIARRHGVTPRAVALAFLTRLPSTFAIPKTSSPEHAAANAAAGDLRLSGEELAEIDAAFPPPSSPRSLPML